MEIIDDEDIFVSVKVYLDDFKTVLEMSEDVSIDFSDSVNVVQNQEYIMNYFSKKMNVEYKNKRFNKFIFFDWKHNEEAGWFNFTINNSVNVIPDKLTNEILLDLYPDQTNLSIVYYKGKEYGYRFNHKKTCLPLKFKD